MCGIIGYIGNKEAPPTIISGLKALEYRGYDSAGICVSDKNGKLHTIKSVGEVSALEKKLSQLPQAHIGIGHTRWATHGAPTENNAHPHLSADGKIAIAHNGIIDNYLELKTTLIKKGVHFSSETDSEVVAHVLNSHYKGNLPEAMQKTVAELKGSFALVALATDKEETLVCARKSSPLIIGTENDESLIASDTTPLIGKYTNAIFLEDNQIAQVTQGKVDVYSFDGKRVKETHLTIPVSSEEASKGTFAHFMLKEIHEQPAALARTLAHTTSEHIAQAFTILPKRILFVGCGTSYHAGLYGKYLLNELTRIQCDIAYGSELSDAQLTPNTTLIVLSQSGETADTLSALRRAKEKGLTTISIVNAPHSSLAREATHTFFTNSGIEIGVASTKAFTGQLAMLARIATQLAKKSTSTELQNALSVLPQKMYETLLLEKEIATLARSAQEASFILTLGKGLNVGLALEGALKIKEIAYIPTDGMPSGEIKHGALALVSKGTPSIILAPHDEYFEKNMTAAHEISARGGNTIIITNTKENIAKQDTLMLPTTNKYLFPLLAALTLQLFAYHVALARGLPIDKPRNLAKSVTFG